ncbi:putative deacetylase LmbE-like domain-containing protein [Sphaerosporella brunnea]|uniref:N-acetylglucosaminylphosphatidylinositol deacetylase n=1 Tax=Sphaerosporella brunnea TaxID=1250544 RepID=A0A5J5ERG3_9PEZI|nr:putative deacetylase LmbE-like domain-containing protein [Sphaerosporella brunnea]
MSWTTFALTFPILLPLLWICLYSPQRPPAVLTNKTITLLIAHPDDEAMFFSPTLLALAPHNKVQVLCLSTGNADGLGEIRKGELVSSCRELGVASDDDVVVIDDAGMPDSMTRTWPASKIAQYLERYAADSDAILTFDEGGVSSHPNHISLLHGAREFVAGKKTIKKLYKLTSVPILRKYLSVFDVPLTFRAAARSESEKAFVFVSSSKQVRTAQRAMTDSHVSQMRWFRWGWIGLSRYMVVNDLVEENLRG